MKMSFTSRRITRAQWKALWRQLRIINREIAAAWTDTMVFGTGALRIGASVPDLIQHIDPAAIFFESEMSAP